MQLLQIGALLPADNPWLAWPHNLHAWFVEALALLGAIGLWAVHHWSVPLERWWREAGPGHRAEALVLVLLLIQAVLIPAYWLTRNHGVESLGWLRAAFYPGAELSIPALFATAQLLLAAAFAWRCWQISRALAWLIAAMACAYMGLDELLMIHERVGQLLLDVGWVGNGDKASFQIGDWRSFLWILFFVPIAVGLGLWLLAAFRRILTGPEVALLVCAAALFLTGAVLFETVQATGAAYRADWWESNAGQLNLLLEEWLETLGVTVAIYVFSRSWWRYASAFEPHAEQPLPRQRAGSMRGQSRWLAGQPQKPAD